MNITFISDTHGYHRELNLKGGDVLIHTGDFLKYDRPEELVVFLDWIRSQPYQQKVLVAGNHDLVLEEFLGKEHDAFSFEGIDYGVNKQILIGDKKVWLSPYQPEFFNWAFNLPRNSKELKHNWDLIPEDTQLLLTHSPPFGTLDLTKDDFRVGCEMLTQRITQLPSLEIHAFGHVHESYGLVKNSKTGLTSINASIMGKSALNKPIVLDIN